MTLAMRVILGVLGIVLLNAGVFFVSLKNILGEVEQELVVQSGSNALATAKAALAQNEKPFVDLSRKISRNKDLSLALEQGNDALLTDSMKPTFNANSGIGAISDLIFFDLSGEVVKAFSTYIEDVPTTAPALVKEVVESTRAKFSTTNITQDRVGAGLSFPIRKGRKIVGFGFIALDAQAALPGISNMTSATAMILRVTESGEITVLSASGLPEPESTDDKDLPEASDNVSDETPVDGFETAPITAEELALASKHLVTSDSHAQIVDVPNTKMSFVSARETLQRFPDGAALDLILMSDFSSGREDKNKAVTTAVTTLIVIAVLSITSFLIWMRAELGALKLIANALSAVASGEKFEIRNLRRPAFEINELCSAFKTFALRMEQEVEQTRKLSVVVDACATGDFSARLDTSGVEGSLSELCQGVSRIGASAQAGLSAIQTALTHLEKGDLGHRMPDQFEGIFGEIAESVNASFDSLNRVVNGIDEASKAVHRSSHELSETTRDLARNTERNAADLETSANSVDRMALQVRHAADEAGKMRDTVETISKQAQSGQELATRAVKAMDEIKESSDAIEQVVDVIEKIAFQTNLLALNASVEAARAGAAGKGFSVVAAEVRELALRASGSVKDITDLINASAQQVQTGVSLVNESGDAMMKIVLDVTSSVGMIDAIANSTSEMSDGISNINKSSKRLEQAMQQSAAAIEETSAAIQMMEEQARALAGEAGSFESYPMRLNEMTETALAS